MLSMSKEESCKLWGGRFSGNTSPILEKLNQSIDFDKRMCQEDLKGSEAYANALLRAGILSEEDTTEIIGGLKLISLEWETDTFAIQSSDEDIHTAHERRLKELIGLPATKLHTGRSRNDQVATDMRLWLRSAISRLYTHLLNLIAVMMQKSEAEQNVLMPGYTHLQKAQPVRLSHWLLSHCWKLKEDGDRLRQVSERVNTMPLGSGALAGNPFPIDRNHLAKDLGFKNLSLNSMHAVGDRDFIAEFLFWASLTGVHLSQLAEDMILFSSQEFGFLSLADSQTTGSSLMPQKKNPDSLELIRGKAGRVFGKCAGFMMVLKSLPSTYNKDLQEDKEAMFDVYDTMESVLQVAKNVVSTMKVNEKCCSKALSPDMLATDVAYYLVRKGVPFREAHHIAGQVVANAEEKQILITDLSMEDLKSISPHFEENIRSVWNYNNSVEQYKAAGGTSSMNVNQQINQLEKWMEVCGNLQ